MAKKVVRIKILLDLSRLKINRKYLFYHRFAFTRQLLGNTLMSKTIKLKKGYDIKLVGDVSANTGSFNAPQTYSVKPTDFVGLSPKLKVEVGVEVKAGTPLFFIKEMPEVMITAPVSGEVIEINRGAKRAILEIKILADSKMAYEQFAMGNPGHMDAAIVKQTLLNSGAWATIKQRPFTKIANPAETPKNIFISGFDSSPLAPDYNYILKGRDEDFQWGINALKKLTTGKIFLSLKAGVQACSAYTNAKDVETANVSGPHPAGNVGVQIHHIAPISKGDVVWTINPEDVANIGKLFKEGKYEADRTIALTGSEVNESARKYYTMKAGACIETLINGNTASGSNRIISGNVLTGSKIGANGYLGFYDRQITVIPEGEDPEFLGWLIPTYSRPSISKTFLSYLTPNKKYKVNTNMHGEERALVVTGEYEKVLPMDILPQYLLKAILANDLEAMESLGLLELDEEDMALCEFVCTSKMPIQQLIRQGLAVLEKEG